MSFWKRTPGPTWWDCIESLNPCISSPYGLCNANLEQRPRFLRLPKKLHASVLSAKHALELACFLKEEFTIYPRCRISLSKERIEQGFRQDNWIGVGIFTREKHLIACCISKPLGRMKFSHETLENGGIVDFFCVHKNYRKQGLAEFLLDELVVQTAKQDRLVHIFLKEGFPIWRIPPLYYGQYIARRKETPGEGQEYFGSMGIGLHSHIQSYSHGDYLPIQKLAANLPYQLNGDSELFSFSYKGHSVFLCLTDLHHVTVPEGYKLGELSWALPMTAEVPLAIQKLAVETCVDCSKYDIVLLDSNVPHDTKKGWSKDATYSWYCFNYNPGVFFTAKPFWIV